MAALVAWAAIDVLNLVVAVGQYEDRITVVTHGGADVFPAWLVYVVFDAFMPYGMVTTVVAGLWMLGLIVVGIAAVGWLVRLRYSARRLGDARPIVRMAPPGRWWAGVMVTVLLNGLVALYSVLTSDGGAFEGAALDTRLLAYPLWTAETVAFVVTAALTARVVLELTEAQLPAS